jgi:hypothetical protein
VRLRRPILAALLILGTTATPASTGIAMPQDPPRRAVELTFLKSLPGEREHLKQYIVLNWFAMDRIARAQGLLEGFTVVDTGTDDGPWNVLVAVTYRDARGYEGIVEPFERIRRAHQTVPVAGKGLRELGAIVESRKTFEDPAHRTP